MKTRQTIGLALAVAFLTMAVPAASGRVTLRATDCKPPSTVDSLCRERATLRVRKPWTPTTGATDVTEVTSNATVTVMPLTGVTVIRGGVTTIYFKKQATCQAVDPDGSGTRIQTRISSRVLFYQAYGLTLCTMADGSVVAEGPGATLKASDPPRGKRTGGELLLPPTQFIAMLDPSAGLRVFVHSGKLLVTLSKGKTIAVKAHKGFDAALIGPGTFSIAEPYPWKFTPDQEALFAFQMKRFVR